MLEEEREQRKKMAQAWFNESVRSIDVLGVLLKSIHSPHLDEPIMCDTRINHNQTRVFVWYGEPEEGSPERLNIFPVIPVEWYLWDCIHPGELDVAFVGQIADLSPRERAALGRVSNMFDPDSNTTEETWLLLCRANHSLRAEERDLYWTAIPAGIVLLGQAGRVIRPKKYRHQRLSLLWPFGMTEQEGAAGQ